MKVIQKKDKKLKLNKRIGCVKDLGKKYPVLQVMLLSMSIKILSVLKRDIDGIKVEGFMSNDNWLFKYDNETNTFGILSDKETNSTMFYPKKEKAYWKEQIDKYKGVKE